MKQLELFPEMRRNDCREWRVIALAAVLAILMMGLVGYCVDARGDHLPDNNVFIEGEVGYSRMPICDTQEQAENIARAAQESFAESYGTYAKYSVIKNEDGESQCGVPSDDANSYAVIPVETVGTFPNAEKSDGERVVLYVLRVQSASNPEKEYYLLSTWPLRTREEIELGIHIYNDT